MNKLDKLLQNKKEKILSIYFTAGYPDLTSTTEIIESLEENGIDLIEIGIPFSDPVADGPVIQKSSLVALNNGMTLKKLFEQLKPIAATSNIPKVLMGYLNPVLQFGVKEFCQQCKECGIDGLIIPDLPLMEYQSKYKALFQKFGLHAIFLVSPQTSQKRLKEISDASTSFLYAVSTNSTTGGELDISQHQNYYQSIGKYTGKPFFIGFGVKDKDTFGQACQYAHGAIIGTAFINSLNADNLKDSVKNFVQSLKN